MRGNCGGGGCQTRRRRSRWTAAGRPFRTQAPPVRRSPSRCRRSGSSIPRREPAEGFRRGSFRPICLGRRFLDLPVAGWLVFEERSGKGGGQGAAYQFVMLQRSLVLLLLLGALRKPGASWGEGQHQLLIGGKAEEGKVGDVGGREVRALGGEEVGFVGREAEPGEVRDTLLQPCKPASGNLQIRRAISKGIGAICSPSQSRRGWLKCKRSTYGLPGATAGRRIASSACRDQCRAAKRRLQGLWSGRTCWRGSRWLAGGVLLGAR